MFKKLTYISFVFLSFVSGQTEYEQWLKDQKAGLNSMAAAENAYMASVTKEFDNYIVEQEQLYQDFKDEVEKKWDAFKFSSSKTYVDYDNDLNARASVDFEKGLVEVEVIVEDDPKQSVVEKKNAGDKKLQKKLTQIIQKKADDDKPLLKDQLQNNQGRKVTTSNAKSFAKEIVNQKKVKKVEFEGKDGLRRIKYTLKLKLQPNHVNTRANRFKQDVITQSKRFNIDPAVAFAIMQTESSFNPKARSHIPAYGLMQLVPKSVHGMPIIMSIKKINCFGGDICINLPIILNWDVLISAKSVIHILKVSKMKKVPPIALSALTTPVQGMWLSHLREKQN